MCLRCTLAWRPLILPSTQRKYRRERGPTARSPAQPTSSHTPVAISAAIQIRSRLSQALRRIASPTHS